MVELAERPAPRHLQTLLEAVAAIMGLDHGRQRLELVFEDGLLRQWWSHAEKRSPRELDVYDERAARLVASQALAGSAETGRA